MFWGEGEGGGGGRSMKQTRLGERWKGGWGGGHETNIYWEEGKGGGGGGRA